MAEWCHFPRVKRTAVRTAPLPLLNCAGPLSFVPRSMLSQAFVDNSSSLGLLSRTKGGKIDAGIFPGALGRPLNLH